MMKQYSQHKKNQKEFREDFIREICWFEESIGLKCIQCSSITETNFYGIVIVNSI